uniref:Uncharacterized protein n=1 Tax=Angiostrongylus cantonensis TaxID=6313 RepID=A0A0K0CW09_ANGCA
MKNERLRRMSGATQSSTFGRVRNRHALCGRLTVLFGGPDNEKADRNELGSGQTAGGRRKHVVGGVVSHGALLTS